MDNITHSLVGALLGIWLTKKDAQPSTRAAVISSSILANNFPDADIFYAPYFSVPFGNLLHHRGYTHTILGVIACGILVWAIIASLWKLRGRSIRPDGHQKILATALLGGLHT